MEKSKLMTPLFYGDMYNRENHKMRAVLEREISDGTQTYRLWRSAGKPDLDYPSAENDKYILHVEINGYLLPLRMTDWNLINHCGFAPAVEKLYGGKENRGKRFDALRESGGDDAVSAALAEERARLSGLAASRSARRNISSLCFPNILTPIRRQRKTAARPSRISPGR